MLTLMFAVAVILCDDLTNPNNGTVLVETLHVASFAKFSCDSGYMLLGSEVLSCEDSGNWNATQPTCTGRKVL